MSSSAPSSSSANEIRAAIDVAKGNFTALNGVAAPAWVDGPEFRGTLSIIVSCLATLVACLYTALHLNLPQQRGTWPELLQKLKWLLVGTIFPDFVVFSAIRQYMLAWSLSTELTKLQAASNSADKKFRFDTEYGFFVVAGGVAISVDEILPTQEERQSLQNRHNHPAGDLWPGSGPCLESAPGHHQDSGGLRRLRPDAVLELARSGVFLYIPPETIKDKSKANVFQKTLVLAQVLWMVMQCVARKSYNLPLTLLEVHTMVHVLCALLIYAVWWNKPQGVTVPEKVDQRSFEDLVALMVQEDAHLMLEYGALIIYADAKSAVQIAAMPSDLPGGSWVHVKRGPAADEFVSAIPFDKSSSWMLPGQVLDCGVGLATQSKYCIQITHKDMLRFERVVQAIRRLDGEPLPAAQRYCPRGSGRRYLGKQFHTAFVTEPNNIPWLGEARHLWGQRGLVGPWGHLTAIVLILTLPFLYGGIHLTAWSFRFPSAAEDIMWKVSSLVITGMVPLNICFVLVYYMLKETWHKHLLGELVGQATLVVELVARLYIVVESFISLRSVPIGVYWTPSWLQMIPHL